MTCRKSRQCTNRLGATAVEFACVAPVVFLVVFGLIELGRTLMVQQLLVNATREGARKAALPGVTRDAVETAVTDYLQGMCIAVDPANISITPDPATCVDNQTITVAIALPYAQVSWVPKFSLTGSLEASARMRSERFR
jgi:Flp pilus assembly protein TadG